MQYTEGVTIENIPSLIKQLHPDAWRDTPEVLKDDKPKVKVDGKKKRDREETVGTGSTKIRGLTVAICMFLGDIANWHPEKKNDDIKYAFPLMARTDFYSMYHDLDKDEATEFKTLFGAEKTKFYGYLLDGQVAPKLKLNVTVRQWLNSIVGGRPSKRANNKDKIVKVKGEDPKDLMSPPPGLNTHGMIDDWNERHPEEAPVMKHAMGMYELDDNLALFEMRKLGSALGQDLEKSLRLLDDVLLGTAGRDPEFATDDSGAGRSRPRRRDSSAGKVDPIGDRQGKKLGVDYMPTPVQLARMSAQGRKLDWVEPDGFCMLGALAKVGGTTVKDLKKLLIQELDDDESDACAFINEFVVEYDAAAIRKVVKNLKKYWNAPAADAVLPVAALVAGLGVTVIEPDGTPIKVNGGGTMLLHVTNPLGHYHSTRPVAKS